MHCDAFVGNHEKLPTTTNEVRFEASESQDGSVLEPQATVNLNGEKLQFSHYYRLSSKEINLPLLHLLSFVIYWRCGLLSLLRSPLPKNKREGIGISPLEAVFFFFHENRSHGQLLFSHMKADNHSSHKNGQILKIFIQTLRDFLISVSNPL